jgi:hypothetical protein
VSQGGRQWIQEALCGGNALTQPSLGNAGFATAPLDLLGEHGLAEQIGKLVQPSDRAQGLGVTAARPRRFTNHGARMDPIRSSRPVSSPATAGEPRRPPSPPTVRGNGVDLRRCWPAGAREAAEALQRQLSIGDRDWHALKAQPRRRAAEQLAAALVQLLATDVDAGPGGGAGADDALALIDSAEAWLRGSQRDPGCPRSLR